MFFHKVDCDYLDSNPLFSGADLGGGGFGGFRKDPTPCHPKGPPSGTFYEIHFWPTDPKIFLKPPLAPKYTNFEGGACAKKTQIFCQIFPKSAQQRLFDLFFFFKNLTAAQKIWRKQPLFVLRRARKINLLDLKKVKIFENFLNNRPPLEKILDPPPGYSYLDLLCYFFPESIA